MQHCEDSLGLSPLCGVTVYAIRYTGIPPPSPPMVLVERVEGTKKKPQLALK